MYGYIYMTTNLVNGRKYIGQKKSSYFKGEDYLGSGKILRQAIEKYGWSSFKVKLIEECSTKEELDCREKYWIKYYNAVDSQEFYNIAFGGQSQVHRQSEESKLKMSLSHLSMSDETRRRMSESQKRRFANSKSTFYGKHHTDESKKKLAISHLRENLSEDALKKISENATKRNTGRLWVNDSLSNKFIRPEDLDHYLSEGYVVGRLQSNEGHKGTFFINNGLENKLIHKGQEIPEGWKKGMIRR